MNVAVGDEVEGDVDTSGARGHGIGVLIDGPPVEGIHLRRLGYPSGGADLLGYSSSFALVRPARKILAPSRAKARATAPPIEPPPP